MVHFIPRLQKNKSLNMSIKCFHPCVHPCTAVSINVNEVVSLFSVILTGEIRCHCNGASCVGSSYMCKSSQGCFSQLSYGHDSRSIHGCVESLAEEDRAVCQGDGDILRTRTGPDKEWPILMCCKEDMCNYMDTRSSGLDVNIYVNTRSNGSSGKE